MKIKQICEKCSKRVKKEQRKENKLLCRKHFNIKEDARKLHETMTILGKMYQEGKIPAKA